jgi:putative transcriptional regulator
MQSTGKILFSTTHNNDIHFQQSIILIAEHNADGAIGFVVNKIFERGLNELAEFSNSPAFPLYVGGPVSKEHLYFIHRRNDIIHGGTLIEKDIYYGGDFKQAIALINNHKLNTNDIKIFIGYCGWDKDEIETEIKEGSWELKNFNSNLVFSL